MNAINAMTLTGLGCACESLGSVLNYDQIKIGGKTYSVNQLVGKTVVASVDTKLYSNPYGQGRVVGTTKAGQAIGIVYSYLRADQADGRSWLMFDGANNTSFYVPNEAVSGTGLKDQGTLDVKAELKKEEEEAARRNDPVGYYLKKFGLPVLLIGGGIYLAATYGKAFITAKVK